MSLDEAVNNAAAKLPEGSSIEIVIENGGYGVTLVAPSSKEYSGMYMQYPMSEDSIESDISEAVKLAIKKKLL